MRLYVDIDDVLAETTRRILRLANRRFGSSLTFEELGSFDLGVALGLDAPGVHELFAEVNAPGFLDRLPTRRGALPALRAWAAAGHTVSVVTGRPPYTRELTAAWLERRGVVHDSLLFVDKYGRFPDAPPRDALRGLRFDAALEDSLETAAFLLEIGVERVFLFDRPWNRETGALPPARLARIRRVSGWRELAPELRALALGERAESALPALASALR